ncbi:hypothetical protein L916_01825, partial [Phytophthora nicotianae]
KQALKTRGSDVRARCLNDPDEKGILFFDTTRNGDGILLVENSLFDVLDRGDHYFDNQMPRRIGSA